MGSGYTAAFVLSCLEKLEEDSAKFYEQLAKKYTQEREVFLSFSKESQKNKRLLTRTYQETITDALEAGFSFTTLDINRHIIQFVLQEEIGYVEALKKALQLEERASAFYLEAADVSEPLLATIPKVLRRIASERKSREFKLGSIIENLER